MVLKLKQAQVWKKGDHFIRIVRLERLEVEYRVMAVVKAGEGTHHHASKKEFCKLLKNATLVEAQKPDPGV